MVADVQTPSTSTDPPQEKEGNEEAGEYRLAQVMAMWQKEHDHAVDHYAKTRHIDEDKEREERAMLRERYLSEEEKKRQEEAAKRKDMPLDMVGHAFNGLGMQQRNMQMSSRKRPSSGDLDLYPGDEWKEMRMIRNLAHGSGSGMVTSGYPSQAGSSLNGVPQMTGAHTMNGRNHMSASNGIGVTNGMAMTNGNATMNEYAQQMQQCQHLQQMSQQQLVMQSCTSVPSTSQGHASFSSFSSEQSAFVTSSNNSFSPNSQTFQQTAGGVFQSAGTPYQNKVGTPSNQPFIAQQETPSRATPAEQAPTPPALASVESTVQPDTLLNTDLRGLDTDHLDNLFSAVGGGPEAVFKDLGGNLFDDSGLFQPSSSTQSVPPSQQDPVLPVAPQTPQSAVMTASPNGGFPTPGGTQAPNGPNSAHSIHASTTPIPSNSAPLTPAHSLTNGNNPTLATFPLGTQQQQQSQYANQTGQQTAEYGRTSLEASYPSAYHQAISSQQQLSQQHAQHQQQIMMSQHHHQQRYIQEQMMKQHAQQQRSAMMFPYPALAGMTPQQQQYYMQQQHLHQQQMQQMRMHRYQGGIMMPSTEMMVQGGAASMMTSHAMSQSAAAMSGSRMAVPRMGQYPGYPGQQSYFQQFS